MFRDARRGTSLLEALVAAVGLLLLVTLALRTFGDLARQAAAQRTRATRLQSSRIARSVLRAEVAELGSPGDLAVLPPDSLNVKSFRGAAYVCPAALDSVVDVRWSGRRAPDPRKDSVLALLADGRWVRSDLVRVTRSKRGACDGAGTVSTWTLRPPRRNAVLLRFFESGSYHLSDGALRYRSGGSGRQPLTESALGAARFSLRGDVVRGEWPTLTAESGVEIFLARLRTPK